MRYSPFIVHNGVLPVKKWIWISIAVIVVLIGFGMIVYLNAMEPMKKAENIAIEIATKEASIETVTDFSLYNGAETYYVIRGTNSQRENIIVWIPEKNTEKVIVKKEKEGISKEQAIQKLHKEKNPEEIITVKLGMENNIPLWEIYYRSNDDLINYYYIDFESGEWLKDIQNL